MRKRYLVIVEKAHIKKLLQKALEPIIETLSYDLDVAVANNHIIDITDKVLNLSEKDLAAFEPVCLNSREIPSQFMKAKDDEKYYEKNGDKIMELVAEHSYDCIINGCDTDEAGYMIFDYTIESLELETYPIKQIYLADYSEEAIRQKFLSASND